VYFGASMDSKIQDGYVFGLDYTFKMLMTKVKAPSDPYINHWLLDEENAARIYGLISGNSVV
jgi:hypothetical protein